MAEFKLPVVIHGITGRMGQIALGALNNIVEQKTAKVDNDVIVPVPIGVGRNPEKLKRIAENQGLTIYFSDPEQAMEHARQINPSQQVYHNTVATGIRREIMLDALRFLDASETSVYCEKPLAGNYRDGFDIVDALEKGGFLHGVVHHMLATPGVRRAVAMMPEIKPLSAQMVFGYEVGSGLSGNRDYSGQRPDFNWLFDQAGGGIILDMCHEGYLSKGLFGETERLSAVARLLVPQRLSTDGKTIIDCDVEDYAALRREHKGGVVNISAWSWFRRINSEFGPLEITVDGENGSLVFGLYGLKVQWKESAPANRWEKSVTGQKIEWRDHWQYLNLDYQDPFAFELAEYLQCVVKREKYPKDAIQACNILGQVEALYESASQNGRVIESADILTFPAKVPSGWKPERLQGNGLLVEIDH
ncbi:Gfo/Idh/MocA family oxidoreductase [candidate division KSB1 bacterium]|nr:Gfo/Idh/MocA family oxidoreductase [candidate division KSB1 bacterium]